MNSAPQPPSPRLVETAAELADLMARLARHRRLGFDTESASFHRYVDRVYLIQVSTADETALIDPLVIGDLAAIGRILADPGVEIVFHDADYDLRTLDRDYGFRCRNLFDTHVAARLAGESAVGLGSLLRQHLGVTLDKKYQRADWSRRPLTPAMTAYAAADTHYLLALRDLLAARLRALGRFGWAEEEFRLLEEVRWTGATEDAADAYLRLKGARRLSPRALAILKRLYLWRDASARRRDWAPFRIIGNSALMAIAQGAPRNMGQLLGLPDVPATLARRHGRDLLRAVREGLAIPADQLPRIERGRKPAHDPGYDARLDRLRALRRRRAEQLGLDPGLVCPNATLQAIARLRPVAPGQLAAINELREWQREVLGDQEILKTVRTPETL